MSPDTNIIIRNNLTTNSLGPEAVAGGVETAKKIVHGEKYYVVTGIFRDTHSDISTYSLTATLRDETGETLYEREFDTYRNKYKAVLVAEKATLDTYKNLEDYLQKIQ
jgi:hypothetical protein